MVLQHLGGPSHSARVYNFFSESLVTDCNVASDSTPILGTDGIGSIDYNVGLKEEDFSRRRLETNAK